MKKSFYGLVCVAAAALVATAPLGAATTVGDTLATDDVVEAPDIVEQHCDGENIVEVCLHCAGEWNVWIDGEKHTVSRCK